LLDELVLMGKTKGYCIKGRNAKNSHSQTRGKKKTIFR